MSQAYVTSRRVEFCETDAAGIVHFSWFMRYMEQAEHAFLRHLGTSVVTELEGGWHLSWPRVHVECDYQGVARFEDVLEISLSVLKLGRKSVTYGFEFSQAGGIPIATGKVVAVCCKVRVGSPLESTTIPAHLGDLLLPYCVTESN
ncbi:acyl-CoA thioesterase [Aureliella helgolandensis]|uniref:Acyl-CoA thioesterase YbgC n=1 Tax=Aureliella helgolandensis TaxID=2527968 RepID=A0A518G2I1_9BACT|nr:acyl-CoA thioesterase [Aureliella helgolandensis]QDV22770.1 acyl-CoA thioesterase YbgC [Aureliella helgolandensis]